MNIPLGFRFPEDFTISDCDVYLKWQSVVSTPNWIALEHTKLILEAMLNVQQWKENLKVYFQKLLITVAGEHC
jgi:hypothetical protein